MSGGIACSCRERSKSLADRQWRVMQRHYQRSAFNGYRREYTSRSTVRCLVCGGTWRTKAGYVEDLLDYEKDNGGK